MEEQRYTLGRQSFETIIEERRVYVDKTKEIYDLVNRYPMVFLARPRRFGKSLLLSTIKAFFEGKKDLFKGTAIYNIERNWQPFPVFHLDLSGVLPTRASALEDAFTSPVALLYQTGYLTIKSYDSSTKKYHVAVPNREIDRGLFPSLLGAFTHMDPSDIVDKTSEMGYFLKKGQPEGFLVRLRSFLATDPYTAFPVVSELFFEHSLYLLFRSIPLEVEAESPTSFGRRDLVVKTNNFIYIFELKLDKSVSEALSQIDEKEYTLPHRFEGKRIFKIGINFSSRKRTIENWIIEEETVS